MAQAVKTVKLAISDGKTNQKNESLQTAVQTERFL
jgi:hypothetical protein